MNLLSGIKEIKTPSQSIKISLRRAIVNTAKILKMIPLYFQMKILVIVLNKVFLMAKFLKALKNKTLIKMKKLMRMKTKFMKKKENLMKK